MTTAQILESYDAQANSWSNFLLLSTSDPTYKKQVVTVYLRDYPTNNTSPTTVQDSVFNLIDAAKIPINNPKIQNTTYNKATFNANDSNSVTQAAIWVWGQGQDYIHNNVAVPVASQKSAAETAALNNLNTSKNTQNTNAQNDASVGSSNAPFDKRLNRLETQIQKQADSKSSISQVITVPFSTDYTDLATTGYIISQNTLRDKLKADPQIKAKMDAIKAEYDTIAKNDFYKGVAALQNYYATVRLYGSQGGKYLVNQKNQRRWYEVDTTTSNGPNFASTPTTSALISWGGADPYGRTPYQFTDFVFSKYWKKIENNRLITLRRYAAPILDNLNVPGMTNQSIPQNTNTTQTANSKEDMGTTREDNFSFPPMATAITYFGADTGNSLNSILKFTTGVPWEDAQADVWNVTTDSVPSNESGPGALFGGGIAKFAEMLNVAGGKLDTQLVMNKGQLPPDPYENGPYENRIKGPINRIDSVKKRKPGMTFSWDGISLVFEYVARPVGGVNPKAALLDILGNFLVMGSASAVFFGGAHRFMSDPAKYPFMGGNNGIERWYRGDPVGWALTSIQQFSQGGAEPNSGGGSGTSVASNLFKNIEGFFSQLFSGEKGSGMSAITSLFSGGTGQIITNQLAKKSAGQIPYLQGMKAILTGEPVGEWHVTIGNPLNPIAMIGNLICEGITVEFNEELGPDDFPTEMKITVNLKHAMARDRDAIESVFNRGMGRIYSLPDSMSGSADFQTVIDNPTAKQGRSVSVGTAPNRRFGIIGNAGQTGGTFNPKEGIKPNPMGGDISVWNRTAFNLGISENSAQQFISSQDDIYYSVFRTADWIAQRSLQ
jgi:hypothetical protein